MALKAAMWIHGTAAAVEDPNGLIPNGIIREGVGTRFFAHSGSFNWFHMAIPTPVILDGARPKLVKVFVFYRLGSGRIKNVHIWDGPARVKEFNGLNLWGDHPGSIDASNSWTISPPLTIKFGLGISIGIQFNTNIDTPDTVDKLEFLTTTAGADFES
jgi:hypothetical protein